MAVLLEDFVDALKREVQPPGVDLFSGVTNDMWIGYLSDAFWEARLDGFLEHYSTQETESGAVEVVHIDGGVDLPRQMMALVILYAGIKVLRNRILNTNTSFRAKAGPVEFEQQNSATMLAEMLKQLKAMKDRIIEGLEDDATGVIMLDAFSARLYQPGLYFGDVGLSGA